MSGGSPESFSIVDADDECVIGTIDDDDECEIEEDVHSDNDIDKIISNGEEKTNIKQLGDPIIGNYRDDDDHFHDEEGQVHDQLPSPEEIKSGQAYIPTAAIIQQGKKRKYLIYGFGALVLILTATVVGFVIKAIADSSSSSKKKEPEFVFSERADEVLNFLFDNGVTSLPSLKLPRSPEHYAAVFVSDGDVLQLDYKTNYYEFVERFALAVLYYATDGTNWNDSYNFMRGTHHCKWNKIKSTMAGEFIKGVECNENNRVIGLDLAGNNLVGGVIPSEIGAFAELTKLHLHHNVLGSNIPTDLKKLTKLKSIGFMEMSLRGSIPDWIGEMTQLTTLALSKNKFDKGTIPSSMDKLTNLRILGLDGINLHGRFESVKKLHELEVIYLNDNQLTGFLNPAGGSYDWKKLIEFDASNNQLIGSIPSYLLHNSNLQVFDVHRNNLAGVFPDDIMPNDSLRFLALQENQLTGTLSDRIGYLTNLRHLDVGSNFLTGTIPDTIQRLSHLISLSTSVNNFDESKMFNYYTGMKDLGALSVKHNNFTGTFPEFLLQMTQLQVLDLDSNQFHGTIPEEISKLSRLEGLLLNRNHFRGTLPSAIGKFPKLTVLLLDKNDMYGSMNAVCKGPHGMSMKHFVTDCYPSKDTEEPEVDCKCCTMCCNDADPNCNNKKWTIRNDVITNYGDTRMDYDYNVDQAPPGWWDRAYAEATHPAGYVYDEDDSNLPSF